jgi:hypothetical protein
MRHKQILFFIALLLSVPCSLYGKEDKGDYWHNVAIIGVNIEQFRDTATVIDRMLEFTLASCTNESPDSFQCTASIYNESESKKYLLLGKGDCIGCYGAWEVTNQRYYIDDIQEQTNYLRKKSEPVDTIVDSESSTHRVHGRVKTSILETIELNPKSQSDILVRYKRPVSSSKEKSRNDNVDIVERAMIRVSFEYFILDNKNENNQEVLSKRRASATDFKYILIR